MKKRIVAAAVGAGLLAGGLGVAGVASAHDRSDRPARTGEDQRVAGQSARPERGEGHLRGEGRRGMPLEPVAEALGVDVETVRQGLRDGKSVAQLAEENGVPVDDVIDTLTADARTRITEMVNRVPEGRPGR